MPEAMVAFFYFLMRDALTPGAVFELIANARAFGNLERSYSSPGLERCAREAVAELSPQPFNAGHLAMLDVAVHLHLERLRAAKRVKSALRPGGSLESDEAELEEYLQLAALLATARGAVRSGGGCLPT
jgi:hypothetical protein